MECDNSVIKVMQTIFKPSLVSTRGQIYNTGKWIWLFTPSDSEVRDVLHYVSTLPGQAQHLHFLNFNLRNRHYETHKDILKIWVNVDWHVQHRYTIRITA
jgi:hypothetical protein